MDSNNMYQNQQNAGGEPENNQSANYAGNGYQNNNSYTQDPYKQDSYGQNQNYQDPYGQNQSYQDPYNQNMNQQQYPYNNNYNNNYGGNYQAPYGQDPRLELEEPVKMSEWLITFLIMIVPCVNIIMAFVWAFSRTEKKSKSNYFKAYLVILGIIFVLYIVLIIILMAAGYAIGMSY